MYRWYEKDWGKGPESTALRLYTRVKTVIGMSSGVPVSDSFLPYYLGSSVKLDETHDVEHSCKQKFSLGLALYFGFGFALVPLYV